MHKGILAGRLLDAQNRIVEAAKTAVIQHGLDPLLLDELYAAQREKQADVRALYEMEAIGPIVEALNTALGDVLDDEETAVSGLDLDAILAIPGLTKTSISAIESHFEALNAAAD